MGSGVLTGVQMTSLAPREQWDDSAQQVLFELNGITYAATEDPNDGYRSSLDTLLVVNERLINRFPPVQVALMMRTSGPEDDDSDYWRDGQILDFVDLASMKVVLSIGTDNTDDYYPWFVGVFLPENLSCNIPTEELNHEVH